MAMRTCFVASATLRALLVLAFAFTLSAPRMFADDEAPPKQEKDRFIANYTKHEYRIPMRDGVKLFTVIYAPRDRTTNDLMLLTRPPGHEHSQEITAPNYEREWSCLRLVVVQK
jgi:predicted acyl esterase